ncbi:MAG TPA: PDZ domain-containing protein, partial [Polyangia bacterium]
MKTLAVRFVMLSTILASGAALAAPPWVGLQLGPGSFGGARVKAVVPGSPGERAGIHAGEEVLSVDDRTTAAPNDVINAVLEGGVGHAGKLRLVDGKGHTRTITVSYETRPDRETMQRNALMGHAAPDFQPSVQTGSKLGKLSSMRGKVVVIDFFAT